MTTTPLQVLLLESHPHEGADVSRQLEAVGHSVLRCHAVDSPGFPCVGIVDNERCPLRGHVDVAVDVRRAGTSEPTSLEVGVGCSLRVGVPVVEAGHPGPSPLTPWTAPACDDVVAACGVAAASAFDTVATSVLGLVNPIAEANGLDPTGFECTITPAWPVLQVRLSGPPAGHRLEQVFAVRAADAVRTTLRRSFPQISFSYAASEGTS